jgi:hypothetical protein
MTRSRAGWTGAIVLGIHPPTEKGEPETPLVFALFVRGRVREAIVNDIMKRIAGELLPS